MKPENTALREACITWVNQCRCRPLPANEDPDACLESFAAHWVQAFKVRVDEIRVAPNPTVALDWSQSVLAHHRQLPRGKNLDDLFFTELMSDHWACYDGSPKGTRKFNKRVCKAMENIGQEHPLVDAYCSIFEGELIDLNRSHAPRTYRPKPFRQNELALGLQGFIHLIYPISYLAEYRQQLNRWEGALGLLRHCPYVLKAGKTLILTRPPLVTQLNAEGELHCTDGPAVIFEEGDSYYFLCSSQVTRASIERRLNDRAIERIGAVPNSDLRMALIRHVGFERFAQASSIESVQSDSFGSIFNVTPPEAPFILRLFVPATNQDETGSDMESIYEIPITTQTAKAAWEHIRSNKPAEAM